MNLIISNEIKIVNPTSDVRRRINNCLSFPNPEFIKRQRLGIWVGDVPSKIYLFKEDSNNLIIPTGSGKVVSDLLKGVSATVDLADNGPVDYNTKLPLYDYQQLAVDTVIKKSCGILQAPCGSGKTQMGIALAVNLKSKTLWLTHTKDLLNQSLDRASQYIDKNLLGTITSGKVNIGKGITFATVQTLSKLDLSEYKYSFDTIIVDECHNCAGTPSRMTMFSKVVNSIAAKRKYGLSATVHRSDGLIKCTFATLGNIIYTVSESEVADKTMQVTVKRVDTDTTLPIDCLDTDGTLIYSELIRYLISDTSRISCIVDNVLSNKGHSQLILSDRLEHLTKIQDLLASKGYPLEDIRFIHGKMVSKKGKEQRVQALEDMRSGKANILLATYSLAKEGLDIPRLDRLHLTLPKKDYAVVTQSIGRIGRRSDNKADAIAYDYVDDIAYCVKAWAKRKSSYRKKKCKVME